VQIGSVDIYEDAMQILLKMETPKAKQLLTRVLICMLDFCLGMNMSEKAQHVLTQLEEQLEKQQNDPERLQEIGNILRKHDQIMRAVQMYKKALLSLKQRHKLTYLERKDTAKVMISIASSEFMRQNWSEAVKYYEHALASL
jgi:tetratricopeptide (TPR) repeat protein